MPTCYVVDPALLLCTPSWPLLCKGGMREEGQFFLHRSLLHTNHPLTLTSHSHHHSTHDSPYSSLTFSTLTSHSHQHSTLTHSSHSHLSHSPLSPLTHKISTPLTTLSYQQQLGQGPPLHSQQHRQTNPAQPFQQPRPHWVAVIAKWLLHRFKVWFLILVCILSFLFSPIAKVL